MAENPQKIVYVPTAIILDECGYYGDDGSSKSFDPDKSARSDSFDRPLNERPQRVFP